MNEICLKRCMQFLHVPTISILQIFQIHLVCKSTVNWLPEGAGGRGEVLGYPPRQAEGRTLGVFNFRSRFSPLQGSPEKESPSPAGYP